MSARIGFVLAVLAITWEFHSSPAQAPSSRVVAKVNGEAISDAQVEQDLTLLLKDRFKFQAPTEPQRRELRMEVMHVLIDDALMHQFLNKTGIQVTTAEVDMELKTMEARLRQQNPPRTLAEFYRETGQSEALLKANIANMLRWGKYVKAQVQEEDVKRYYDENKEFFDQVMVRASHILIRVGPGASEGERQAARQKLTALRADIAAGKIDFAEAAKKFSQCSSAPNGGDLGFFARKWMLDEAIARTAFALPVGGMSDVVQTNVGLHLVKVTDRKKGEASDYEKIKEEVRLFFAEEMRQQLLLKERRTAKIEMMP